MSGVDKATVSVCLTVLQTAETFIYTVLQGGHWRWAEEDVPRLVIRPSGESQERYEIPVAQIVSVRVTPNSEANR